MRKAFIGVLLLWVGITSAQTSIAAQLSDAFAAVAEKANPAVVTILSEKVVKVKEIHPDFPFDNFFPFFPRNWPEQEFHSSALGSGVIVDGKNGYILTNHHVIADADEIQVKLMDKRVFSAEIVGTDPRSDLAVLKIEGGDLAELELGDSDQLRVGEWVLAVGSPFSANLSHTVTAGIVSALGRSNIISQRNYEDFIQTDAAINPGNSGGALLNLKGELVGINTAIATGGFERANRGVGFAIPSNMAKKVMHDLIKYGYVVRAWLGVYIQEVDDKVARAMELENRDGALVSNVVEDSPADKAGIKTGDVIIRFNDQRVKGPSHLKNLVSSSKPGKRYPVELIRDGKEKTITVTLEELEQEKQQRLAAGDEADRKFGLQVQDLTPSIAEQFGLDPDEKGVLVTDVEVNSAAYKAGIRVGDVITRVGKKEVKSKRDFKNLMKTAKKQDTILLLVKRDDVARFFALDLKE
jgi:serine protease Do